MSKRLEELLEKEKQLKARIQKAKARLSLEVRQQQRYKRLAWGDVVEKLLASGEFTQEQWTNYCHKYLNGKLLAQACSDNEDAKTTVEESVPATLEELTVESELQPVLDEIPSLEVVVPKVPITVKKVSQTKKRTKTKRKKK